MQDIKSAAPQLLPRVLEELQAIRRQALARAMPNAGVAAIYEENYAAAEAYLAGRGDQVATHAGMTARQHLEGYAYAIGMSVDAYARYIIQEYHNTGPSVYAAEQEYLRLYYQAAPREQDLEKLLNYPAEFRQFCGLR